MGGFTFSSELESKHAVTLLSGGLDSAVATLVALRESLVCIERAITFDYGQRSSEREIQKASQLARSWGIPHKVITVPWLADISTKSCLTSSSRIPQPTQEELDDARWTRNSARAVWIPNRNGVFISIAAAIAESLKADAVLVGFNREEATTFPDNSRAFMESMSTSLSYSTANGVSVCSPTVDLKKPEIVALGKKWDLDWSSLWSCYESDEKMCGLCESCQRLKRALARNEVSFDAIFTNPDL